MSLFQSLSWETAGMIRQNEYGRVFTVKNPAYDRPPLDIPKVATRFLVGRIRHYGKPWLSTYKVSKLQAKEFVKNLTEGMDDKKAAKKMGTALSKLLSKADVQNELTGLIETWTLSSDARKAAARAKVNALAFDPDSDPKTVVDALKIINRDEGIGETVVSQSSPVNATLIFSPALAAVPIPELPEGGFIDITPIEEEKDKDNG